ncbi:MAG: hypothetical protein ABJN84_10475 [Flavobacteriaceae bacterium]
MRISLIVLFTVLCISACSDRDDTIPDFLHGSWDVQNISGGFAGIDQDFEAETVIWNFDSDTNILTVVNNHELVDVVYDGLDSGTYEYSILQVEDQNFLIIDEVEFAGFDFLTNQILLDQNKLSTGTGADGFLLLFNRVP